jgi:hypothetical protein
VVVEVVVVDMMVDANVRIEDAKEKRVEESKRWYSILKLKDVACVFGVGLWLLLYLLKSWKRKTFMS